MPIRWKSKLGRRGGIATILASSSADISGEVGSSTTFVGRIQALVYDCIGEMSGLYTLSPAMSNSGVISAQLSSISGPVYGTVDYAAYWSDAVGNVLGLTALRPFSYTFSATDLDGDPIDFSWDPLLVPSWMTITELPQIGNTRELVISSTTGPPEPAVPETTDAYSVSLLLSSAETPAEQDWIARSQAPGVVWATEFKVTDTAPNGTDIITAYGGDLINHPGSIRRNLTSGVRGLGCLELEKAPDTTGLGTTYSSSPSWWRPFDPAISRSAGTAPRINTYVIGPPANYQPGGANVVLGGRALPSLTSAQIAEIKGRDVWVQYRLWCSQELIDQNIGQSGGKVTYVTRSYNSAVMQEINLGQPRSGYGNVIDYYGSVSGQPYFYPSGPQFTWFSTILQQIPWPAEQWFTIMWHLRASREYDSGLPPQNGIAGAWGGWANAPADGTEGAIELFYCPPGGNSWTTLVSRQQWGFDYQDISGDGLPWGWNSLLFTLYENLRDTNPNIGPGAIMRYDQVIVSQSAIPCPQDGL